MDKFCRKVQRRASEIRKRAFPECTDPYSRHLHLMADQLANSKPYPMIEEEPEHVAGSIYATIGNLWEVRLELVECKKRIADLEAELEALTYALGEVQDG